MVSTTNYTSPGVGLALPSPSASPSPVANHTTSRNKPNHLKSASPHLVVVSPSSILHGEEGYSSLTESFLKQTNNGSSLPSKENFSTKDGFQYGNVSLKRVEKPVEDRWKRKNTHDLTESPDVQEKGDEESCGSPASVIGKKGDETNAWSKRRMTLPANLERSKFQQDAQKNKTNTPTSSFLQTPSKVNSFTNRNSSPAANYNKPQALKNRSKSMPKMVGSESVSDNGEEGQNNVTPTLKKVSRPIEDRWKSKKNSDEEVSDASRPSFANLKLRSIETPTNGGSTTPSAKFAEKLQYFDDQKTPKNLKDDGERKLSISKRRLVPSRIDTSQLDGDRDRTSSARSLSKKGLKDTVSVFDLAKTFSCKTLLSSKDEDNGNSSGDTNEITQIRNSLRSTNSELHGIRKTLKSSTSVSRLIAERNKAAAQAKSEDSFKKKIETLEKGNVKRLRPHDRTGSKPSYQMDNRASIKTSSSPCKWGQDRGQDCDAGRGKLENNFECESVDDFSSTLGQSVRWRNFEENDAPEKGDIFPLSFQSEGTDREDDNSTFSNLEEAMPYFDGRDDFTFCTGSDYNTAREECSPSNHNGLLPSNSTISEYSTDTEDYSNYHESRYIQITLSSGGITEKLEPNIMMSTTAESTASEGFSDVSPAETSVGRRSEARRDKRKGRVPLKGAKKFFFGKNKKKGTTQAEI